VVNGTSQPLYPSEDLILIAQEVGWASGLVFLSMDLNPLRFKPWTVHPIVSCYNDYAIPMPRGIILNITHKTNLKH
jgi:hypothetical protein